MCLPEDAAAQVSDRYWDIHLGLDKHAHTCAIGMRCGMRLSA